MQSYVSISTVLCILGTLLAYMAVRALYMRYRHPLINIVALGAAIIITVLVVCDLPYAVYEPAAKIMTVFIGPATVALQAGAFTLCARHYGQRMRRGLCGHVFCGSYRQTWRAAPGSGYFHYAQECFHTFCH